MDAPSVQPAAAPPPGVQPAQPPGVQPPAPAKPDDKQPPPKPTFDDKGVEQQYELMQGKIGAAHDKMAAIPVPQLERKPPPQTKGTNPLETWGSAAMMLAALGSLMTRTPMTTALNSASKVMDAVKKNDLETAQSAFETWKVDNENALKVAQFEMDGYRAAMESAKDDETLAISSFNAYASASNNQVMQAVAKTNSKANIMRAVADQQNAITNAKDSAARMAGEMMPLNIINMGSRATLAWQNAKTPQEREAAKGMLQAARAESSWYSYVTGKGAGGGAGGGAGAPKVTMAMVGMYEAGAPFTSIFKGIGKNVGQSVMILEKMATEDTMRKYPGLTETQAGVLLANKQLTYAGSKKALGTLSNMEGVTKQAVDQLDINTAGVERLMQEMPGTNMSPILNGVIRGIQKWDGDPKYTQMFLFLQASMGEYAKLRMGSQASASGLTEGAAAEARRLADVDITPESWSGFRQGALYEGRKKLKTYKDAKRYMMPNGEMDFTPPKSYRQGDSFFGNNGKMYRVIDDKHHVEEVPLEQDTGLPGGGGIGGGAEFDPSGLP